MAVLIEGISVAIKAKTLLEKYPNGWDNFKLNVPNQTLCADGELIRVGFMSPADVEKYIHTLESCGLVFLKQDVPQDIVVVDQQNGPTKYCDWIEFGRVNLENDSHKEVSASRLVNSKSNQIVMPENWKYENSLSANYTYIGADDVNRRMIRFSEKSNVETYFDLKTGKTLYLGNTK